MIPTKQNLAKSLMDLALQKSAAVEYTAEYNVIFSTRVECYKLRSASRSLGGNIYDALTFSTRPADNGLRTLVVEKRQ